jgi:probable F420-dependent oxidoreductase
MARRCKVGVQLHPQLTTMDTLLGAAKMVEAMGCDSLWTWDHFSPLYGPPQGEHFEGWVTLTAMAMATESIQVGHLVGCHSYRNPDLVADMARTLQHVVGDRVTLGLGSGWFEKDYLEYGYDFGTAIGRLRRLEADLPRYVERLGKLNPAPHAKIPLLIGGGGEKVTLKIVAKFADAWNLVGGNHEAFAAKNAILDQHCADLGRDPAEIERTVLIGAEDLDHVEEFLAAGASHLILMMMQPFEDFSGVEKLLAAAQG